MSSTMSPSGDPIQLSAGDAEAAVAPLGSQPVIWRVGGRNLLWHGDPAHWSYRAPILFPIVGRAAGDTVRVGDQSIPMNQHGFARVSVFRPVETRPDSVRMRLEPADVDSRFPLPYRLDVVTSLTERALTLRFEVSNPGTTALPYSLGFHPAFPWPFAAPDREGHTVEFEADEEPFVPVVTPESLFAPDRRPIPLRGRTLPLSGDLFAANALVFFDARSRSMRFKAPDGSAIEMRVEGFPHLALWTKPESPFLSLECWTGHADPDGFSGDLFEKPSTIVLAPGEERTHVASLIWHPA